MNQLIKPKDIQIQDIDKNTLNIRLSRFPATIAREIITQYPTTALKQAIKQDSAYEQNESMMFKLMSYVEIEINGEYQRLDTRAKIDNFIPDGETLLKIESQMLGYNTDFFHIGRISKGLDGFAVNIKQLATQILTQLQAPSSQKKKRRSKN